jgi:hypothetical protein
MSTYEFPKERNLKSFQTKTILLKGESKAAGISFDLDKVKMSTKQKEIVNKLFDQNPIAVITNEEHSHELEKGKDGPGSKYLNKDEFEEVRKLGARLGPDSVSSGLIIDFCIHAVVVGKLQNWQVDEVQQ